MRDDEVFVFGNLALRNSQTPKTRVVAFQTFRDRFVVGKVLMNDDLQLGVITKEDLGKGIPGNDCYPPNAPIC